MSIKKVNYENNVKAIKTIIRSIVKNINRKYIKFMILFEIYSVSIYNTSIVLLCFY